MQNEGALADNNGTTYFENELKDSAVPPMKGTLVEGKPGMQVQRVVGGDSVAGSARSSGGGNYLETGAHC